MRGYGEGQLEQVKGGGPRCQVPDSEYLAFRQPIDGLYMIRGHRGTVLAAAEEAGIVYGGFCRLPKFSPHSRLKGK
jgi:hypothetical protein